MEKAQRYLALCQASFESLELIKHFSREQLVKLLLFFALTTDIYGILNPCKNKFQCLDDRHCIPKVFFCDGTFDCRDHSDEPEELCNKQTCEKNFKRCSTNNYQCVLYTDFCDGIKDCNFGEDEENCSPNNEKPIAAFIIITPLFIIILFLIIIFFWQKQRRRPRFTSDDTDMELIISASTGSTNYNAGCKPKFNQTGEAKSTIFRPLNLYSGLIDPKASQNIEIWRFESPVHFANAQKLIEFVAEICAQIASKSMVVKIVPAMQKNGDSNDKIGIVRIEGAGSKDEKLHRPPSSAPKPSAAKQEVDAIEEAVDANHPLLANGMENTKNAETAIGGERKSFTSSSSPSHPKGILIIDCAPIAHIDSVGVDALGEMYKRARKMDVQIKFAAFSNALLATVDRCALFQQIAEENFFPCIQDALASSL